MAFKSLTMATLAGVLAATSFADDLLAGVALPAGYLPPPAQGRPSAVAGADFLYNAGDDRFFLHRVHDNKWIGEGGEGGEGAEGRIFIFPIVPVPTPMVTTTTIACGSHQPAAMIIGGIAGAVIGHQFGGGKGKPAVTALGALMGVFVGHSIGAHLDATDAACAEAAATQAFGAPMGTTIQWNNPRTGAGGSVQSTRDGTNARNGQYCREYVQTVSIGGQNQQAYGTACRQPDGSWRITS